ncbi:YSIRK-type signal peptide-containing protein [Streptococcus pluranimalium]
MFFRRKLYEKETCFSLRKSKIGAVSVLLGAVFCLREVIKLQQMI